MPNIGHTSRVIRIDGYTKEEADALFGIPVGKVDWCPNRDSLWVGYGAADGQELDRATFPDIWDAINDGHLPSVDEATWQADPAQRGKYSTGDGETTFRAPDLNGKSSGSHGAVYLTGDGLKTAGENGVIRPDEMQQITGQLVGSDTVRAVGLLSDEQTPDSLQGAFVPGGNTYSYRMTGTDIGGRAIEFDSANSPDARTNTHTHGVDVSGCWVIRLFGYAVKQGSTDVQALATAYTALAAAFDNDIDFTIIYPNGGTAESPADVTVNSRYVEDNPFPGYEVICEAELLSSFTNEWIKPGYYAYTGGGSSHTTASKFINDIVIQTGSEGVAYANSAYTGNPLGLGSTSTTVELPCRVKVWKLKGKITEAQE